MQCSPHSTPSTCRSTAWPASVFPTRAASRTRELVLVVSVALGELPPRHAGHAVRPSQYAVAVAQYGVARF